MESNLVFGVTDLRTRSLADAASFYKALVGLEEIASHPGTLVLGWEGTPLIRFTEDITALPEVPGSAGLYHLALLFDDASRLATVLDRIFRQEPRFFEGSSDHLVSEAFYFRDPDGNGVELYVDRPREQWHVAEGQVAMGVLPLDPEVFVRRHFQGKASGGVSMGHLHLRVGDVAAAERFYCGLLGFSVTAALPSALFVSYDGYHHHLGLNTWESAGAGKRVVETVGLDAFTLLVSKQVFEDIFRRLRAAGVVFSEPGTGKVMVEDPWGTKVRVVQG